MKRSDFPKYCTNDMASKLQRGISLGPPTNDVGNTILFPTLLPLVFPAFTVSLQFLDIIQIEYSIFVFYTNQVWLSQV